MPTPSHAPTDAGGDSSEVHGLRTDSLAGRHNVIPLLVTVPQAATMLAIGRSSVYQLIWKGDLTPVHIGRSVRISVKQLDRFTRPSPRESDAAAG
jgi:excisionase family DNA binding protein